MRCLSVLQVQLVHKDSLDHRGKQVLKDLLVKRVTLDSKEMQGHQAHQETRGKLDLQDLLVHLGLLDQQAPLASLEIKDRSVIKDYQVLRDQKDPKGSRVLLVLQDLLGSLD